MYSLNKKKHMTYLLYKDQVHCVTLIQSPTLFANIGNFVVKLNNIDIVDDILNEFKLLTKFKEIHIKHINSFTFKGVYITKIEDNNTITFTYDHSYQITDKVFRDCSIKNILNE